MKVFLISPVKKQTSRMKKRVAKFVGELEQEGKDVYWPARDCPAYIHGGTEYDACWVNRKAMEMADVAYYIECPEMGVAFGLGMAFALGKKITEVLIPEEAALASVINKALSHGVVNENSSKERESADQPGSPVQVEETE